LIESRSITKPIKLSHTKDFKAKTEFNMIKGLNQTYKPVNSLHPKGKAKRIEAKTEISLKPAC
jgi:hypothetical protein